MFLAMTPYDGGTGWYPGRGVPDVEFGLAAPAWQPQYLPLAQPDQMRNIQQQSQTAYQTVSGGGRAGKQQQPLGRDVCRLCRQTGHWSRECPNNDAIVQQQTLENQAQVGVVPGPRQTSETYIDINIRGKIVQALLDTGCDHCVVPRRWVPTAERLFRNCHYGVMDSQWNKNTCAR
jgi:Zinc knuckle/Retroviral aspartyl protease